MQKIFKQFAGMHDVHVFWRVQSAAHPSLENALAEGHT